MTRVAPLQHASLMRTAEDGITGGSRLESVASTGIGNEAKASVDEQMDAADVEAQGERNAKLVEEAVAR